MFRSSFLLALVASGAAITATPAAADYSATAMRMDGEWETSAGKLVLKFGTFDGELVGDFFHHQYGRKYRIWWVEHYSTLANADKGREIDAYLLVGDNSNTMPCRMFDDRCASGRITLSLSPDGSTIALTSVSGAAIDSLRELKGRRLPVSPEVAQRVSNWVGEWETSNGPLSLRAEGNMLVGTFQKPQNGQDGVVALIAGPTRSYGAWDFQTTNPRQRGRVEFDLKEDKKSFVGQFSYTRLVNPNAPTGYTAWTGQKVDSKPSQPSPAPQPEPAPAPAPPPVATPPMPAPAPVETAAFKSLGRVDVRLDRIVEARGYPTRQVHAFVTIKNASATQQYISSGYLRAILTDADGVAQERNQVWRASGEPVALFNSTPVVQPGAELKVRYVFNPDEGAQPATFALSEGGKRVEFNAGAL